MDARQVLISNFGEPIEVSGPELKFVCTQCGHRSLTGSMLTGVYYCFVCEYGVGQKPLFVNSNYKKRKIDFDKHLEITKWLKDNLTLSNSHRNYLKSRGIYNPDFFGLKTIPTRLELRMKKHFSDTELLDSGFFKPGFHTDITGWPCLKHNRIFIPIMNHNKLCGCKTRCDFREDLQEDVKYAFPTGSRANDFVSYYPTGSDDLLISEGDFKVMAARECGYSSICSSGINGTAALRKFFFNSRTKYKRRFIIFDTEKSDSKILSRVQAYKLSESLDHTDVAIVILPRLKPNTKMDLDTYLLTFPGRLDDLLEEAWYNRQETLDREYELTYGHISH